MTEHDDLERLVRASLDTHAGEVDTTVPVAARARAAARNHRGRWVAAGATVAVAAVAVAAVVIDRADPPRSEEPAVVTPSPSSSQPVMADDWRTEYWHDVSVRVPADWGWGTAPMNPGFQDEGAAYLCGGPGAMRTPDGKDAVNPDSTAPYVGRPIMLSDLCSGGDSLTHPQATYVWFDAQVELGTVDLADGYVQDTVEVDRDGTTVTVGSDDQALRARILASVARQDLCPATVDAVGLDLGSGTVDEPGDLGSAVLCAYSRQNGDYELAYGRELSPETFGRFDRALDRAPEDDRRCKATGDLVVLTAISDGDGAWPVSQTWVADLACGTISSSDGMRKLTTGVEGSWADGGVRSSLPSFNGMFG